MIDEVFDDGDDDGVAHGVVGLVVGRGELVGSRSSHEQGGFAGSDEAGFPFSAIVEEEKLATAAALGGAEAAGEVVEAEFEDLLALAGAAVAGEGGAAAGRESVEELPVFGGGEGDEGGGALFVENGGVPIDEIGESLGALGGTGHGPEDDIIERSDGFENGLGVEPVGAVVFEVAGVEVILNGDDVTQLAQHQRVKRGLVRTFQINKLFADMSALESVTLAVCERLGWGWNWWRPVGDHQAAVDEAAELLSSLGLREVLNQPTRSLAYGKQRLIEIALALAARPTVLLLDEPAAGVPASESRELFETIAQLPRSVTILLIEHDMDLVFRFADRISVLVNGALLAEDKPELIAVDKRVREVYLGVSLDG